MTSLDHVTICALDFAAAFTFYDAVLGAVELVRLDELVDEEEDGAPVEAAAWGNPDCAGLIWLIGGTEATSGLHLRLAVRSRELVLALHAAALANGGSDRSAPRRWPLYRRGEFSAMVTDPAGNVLEAVAPE